MAEKNQSDSAQQLFLMGRNTSLWVEAGIIGILPLILFVLECFSAYAEASLVEQVMPYFEGSFTKAIIYTGAGMAAGIFFAPNFSWMWQCSIAIESIKKKLFLTKEFRDETIKNLTNARRRFAITAIFTLSVAAASHGVTLYFMDVAFNNRQTLELLKIPHMGEVPFTLAVSVSVMGFLLDILLGLTTSTKINIKDFYPSTLVQQDLLDWNTHYENLAKLESDQFDKLVKLREAIANNRKSFDNKMKAITINAKNNPATNNSNNNNGNRNKSRNNNNNNNSNNNNNNNSNNNQNNNNNNGGGRRKRKKK